MVGSWSVIYLNSNIIIDYHWLPHWKCTVNLSYQIDHLHASENILITFLIAVTSRLNALVARKNVLQPMGIR